MQGVDLALVAFRIGQNMGDDPSLVVRAYRGMAPVLKGEFDLLLGPDLLGEMRIDEPVGEKGGTEMRRRDA